MKKVRCIRLNIELDEKECKNPELRIITSRTGSVMVGGSGCSGCKILHRELARRKELRDTKQIEKDAKKIQEYLCKKYKNIKDFAYYCIDCPSYISADAFGEEICILKMVRNNILTDILKLEEKS